MERRREYRWLAIGSVLAVALLVVNGGVAYFNTRQLQEDATRVAHTHEVAETLQNLLSTMKDAETGQRGFLVTGDASYLKPYADALARVDDRLRSLRLLTADNARQQARIPHVEELVRGKLEELARTVALRRERGFDAAKSEVLTHLGKDRMGELRAAIDEMRQDEQSLLRVRQDADERAYAVTQVGIVAGTSLGLAVVVALLRLGRRHLKERAEAAARLQDQKDLLQEQKDWWQTTLSSIGDAVVTTDTLGRVTFLNTVAETLTAWKLDEARGAPLTKVFAIVNEQTRRSVDDPVAKVLATGQVAALANHTVLIAKDGSERPIDDSAAPIRDADERVLGVVLVFREIGERRRAERALAAQARLLNLTHDAIFVRDSDDRITFWNRGAAEMYGWGESEAIGNIAHDLLRTQFPQPLADVLATVRRDGRWTGDLVHTRRDGVRIHVASRWALDRDSNGAPNSILETNIDITDRKAAEAALRDADRRKDEFVATLAHELRNPLAPIRNAVGILQTTGPAEPEARWCRDVIERQVQHMTRLLEDLLDVSRISRHALELRRARVPLATVVDHAVETSRPFIDAARHELTVTLPASPVYLDCDLIRLAQVISNLLNNSAKYTERGGHVRLCAQREGSDVLVSVKDDGIGIAAEYLPRVFEMFSQATPTLERSQGGLGIGLSLVKGLVELHGGSIEARSEGLGRGSEFVVRLPVAVEIPESRSPTVAQRPTVAAAKRRLLIADDLRDGVDSLALLLRIVGHDVRTAYDGDEAVRIAENFRPEVVLLDIGMPKLNGYDACRRLREQPWGKGLVVVAVTGWGQEPDRRRAKEAGFDHHLLKPVNPTDLMSLLAALAPSRASEVNAS